MFHYERRKTTLLHISISSKIFRDTKNVTKCADAIKVWINRFCKKNEDYSVIAIIGISENDCHKGHIVSVRRGKVGRPRKEFLGTDGDVPPHIHIILLANPGETFRKKLRCYLNEKFSKAGFGASGNVCIKNVYETVGLVKYVLFQCKHIRTVEHNKANMLNREKDFGLNAAICTVKSAHRIIFTSLINSKNDSIVEGQETIANIKIPNKSQCNYKNIKTYKEILIAIIETSSATINNPALYFRGKMSSCKCCL